MTLRRGAVVCLMLLAAGLCLIMLTLPWLSALVPVINDASARVPQEFSGSQVLPVGAPLALVSAAAALGLLATRGWGRRIVSGCALASGLLLTGLAARTGLWGMDGNLPAGSVVTVQSPWWIGCVLGGLLITFMGLVGLLGSHQWQRPDSAYERASSEPASGQHALRDGGSTDAAGSQAQLWDAMDRGIDPSQD